MRWVFGRAVADRWVGVVAGTVSIGVLLLGALAAYRTIDTSLYASLPPAVRATMGIPDGADPASLAFGVVFGFIGAVTLASMAITAGAAAIAGEERTGTLGVLLANPISRRRVLAAKTSALVVLVTVGAGVLLVAGRAAPAVLRIDLGSSHVAAFVAHLWVNALFYGAVSLLIGGLSGDRSLASGVSAAVMAVSYFAAGLLPLSPSLAGAGKVFPWYWFDAGDPFVNGIQRGSMGVLAIGVVIGVGGAALGMERRDLRRGEQGGSLIERLRMHPRVAAISSRGHGRPFVRTITAKAMSERRALLVLVSLGMFSTMGVLMGPMYVAIRGTLGSFASSLPSGLLAFFGGGDITTPEGWYQVETFGLMAPLAVMALTVTAGVKALAGEEQARTMGLLLANPISRRRVVFEKAAAMAAHGAAVGVAISAGVVLGSVVSGLGMDAGHIAATSLLAVLLGILFGSFSLLAGAMVGDTRRAAVATAVAVAVAYAANGILSMGNQLAAWSRMSPFEWYLGSDPLNRGLPVSSAVRLLGLSLVLVVAAALAFERRDLSRA